MAGLEFRKATKEAAKLRLAIAGPAGSGKTYTALQVATHLVPGGKIAVVDTEHGSSVKYADIFDFYLLEMHEPYQPQKYQNAIKAAEEAGMDVVILDSLSHAWEGPGGTLDQVEQISQAQKISGFRAWQKGTPIQQAFIESILGSSIHVIATMRTKTEYLITDDDRGRQKISKVGTKPVQRDGMEYEFDIILSMDLQNGGTVEKSRAPQLTGKYLELPGEALAKYLASWLEPGSPEGPEDGPGAQSKQKEPAKAKGTAKSQKASKGSKTKAQSKAQEEPDLEELKAEELEKIRQEADDDPFVDDMSLDDMESIDPDPTGDGWDDSWGSMKDYGKAKAWARESGKFKAEKHLENAWAMIFSDEEAHEQENAGAFLAAWHKYVSEHEDQ